MLKKGVKTVVLYLEDWQKRMVKDILGVDCDTYEVPIEDPMVPKYFVLPHVGTHEGTKRMYFTGWQMREMHDEAGKVCEFIELTKDVGPHFRYGVPTR